MIVFIRKLLDHVFTKKELQVLDDMLPDFHRNNRLDDEEALKVKDFISFVQNILLNFKTFCPSSKQLPFPQNLLKDEEDPAVDRRPSSALRYTETNVEIPMINGTVMKIPHNQIQQVRIM